ncbi:MAG: TlpA family protein disulfide reductase [Clostridia bacterium]|nr:TlpA family protein disulfide reductase [Clostridia bacterium]
MKKYLNVVFWLVVMGFVIAAAYTVYNKNTKNGVVQNPPQQSNGTGDKSNQAPSQGFTAADEPIPITQNIAAPDFTLANLNGETVSLSDYKGKVVFLNFWATWCGPCRSEIPDLDEASKELEKGDSAVFLAINLTDGVRETENVVKNFVQDNKLSFNVLLDHETRIAELYGVESIPTTFVINKDGTLYGYRVGPISKQTILNVAERLK